MEAYMKFIKSMLKKCFSTNTVINLTLLQIRTTPLGPGLPSPAMLVFNCCIKGIMLMIKKYPISADSDDDHYKVLVARQHEMDRKYDMSRE